MNKILLISTFIATMVLHCSVNPIVSGDGGTTEITNAKITGQILKTYMGGELITVPYAEVLLHSAVFEARTTTADSEGFFQFDSVDTGRFWLEGGLNNTLGVVQTVDVLQGDTLVEITVLMEPMGGIRGHINADTTGADPDSVYKTTIVTIYEIEKILPVNRNGIFEDRTIPYFNNYTVAISNDMFPLVSGLYKVGVKRGRVTELDGSNSPPMFSHDASAMTDTAYIGVEYRDTVHAVDPDGDILEFVLTKGPKFIELEDSIIVFTPGHSGGCMNGKPVSVQVQDNKGGYDILNWNIKIFGNVFLKRNHYQE